MTIGERIKQLRAKEKISQRYLARILNVSQTTISTYETDTIAKPDEKLLSDMANVFNINYNEMIDGCIISNTANENRKIEALEIGQQIKQLRKLNELSLEELSQKVGLSRSTLSKIETGGYDIRFRPKLKEKLCAYYSSVEKIIDDVNNKYIDGVIGDNKNEIMVNDSNVNVEVEPEEDIIVDINNEDIKEETDKKDINIFDGFKDIEPEYYILIFNNIHNKLSYIINNIAQQDIDIDLLEKEIEWFGVTIGDNKILKYKLDMIKKYKNNK